MGRRARTNCSPIDSAMEKYHNDIGNRLSGVFIPTHPCPANNDSSSSCEAFSMLTLDLRGQHGVKSSKTQPSVPTTDSQPKDNEKSTFQENFNDSQKDDSAFDPTPKRTDTLSSLNSHTDSNSSSAKEKRNIMDKLARAIFQRKHTCARCQRRSRSCLQNKTFNVIEKHYTCGRCRESSRAIKYLVSGQGPSTNNGSGDTAAINNADIVVPKPRVQLKDSGYETVTSCSTVASAHSHSNSPYASANRHTDKTATPCSRLDVTDDKVKQTFIPKDNTGTPCQDCPEACNALQSSDTTTQSTYANSNNGQAGLEHFMGVVGDDGVRVLKQVKTRYVHNYDGYLPNPLQSDLAQHNGHHHHQQHIDSNVNSDSEHTNNNTHKLVAKACHICATSSRPCFRLPWEGGWLCEDCIDGML